MLEDRRRLEGEALLERLSLDGGHLGNRAARVDVPGQDDDGVDVPSRIGAGGGETLEQRRDLILVVRSKVEGA